MTQWPIMRRISSLVRWQKAYQVRRGNSFTAQLLEIFPTCTAVLLPTWYLPSETKKTVCTSKLPQTGYLPSVTKKTSLFYNMTWTFISPRFTIVSKLSCSITCLVQKIVKKACQQVLPILETNQAKMYLLSCMGGSREGAICPIAPSKTGVTSMRPSKEFRAAREAFRRDQQSWTNRFHSMTKKLCGPITQR